mmetsp:Transcript_12790/g.37166  ORF Transcript_12790/g.37166 Transcript_12790/m.37166 type:complete len:117 (-) Transcript_12790:8-358(-)
MIISYDAMPICRPPPAERLLVLDATHTHVIGSTILIMITDILSWSIPRIVVSIIHLAVLHYVVMASCTCALCWRGRWIFRRTSAAASTCVHSLPIAVTPVVSPSSTTSDEMTSERK